MRLGPWHMEHMPNWQCCAPSQLCAGAPVSQHIIMLWPQSAGVVAQVFVVWSQMFPALHPPCELQGCPIPP